MKQGKQNVLLLMLSFVLLAACAEDEQSDAYGQFEANEVTVSAKVSGELLSFTATEGEQLPPGKKVAVIDTTQLSLQKRELQARLSVTESKNENIGAEINVLQEQLRTARINLQRIKALESDNAATQQQLDDAEGKVRTLQKQIEALQIQKQSVRAEVRAIEAQISQLEQQISDAVIENPVEGRVLTKYVEQHELVSRGQPLYQVASLDTLELRVYVSGAQLPSVKLGQMVEIIIDKDAEEDQQLSGKVSWIASEAEFTPKMIQTKEERVTQVYAVKVRVPNPRGVIKIGMPGEVNFE